MRAIDLVALKAAVSHGGELYLVPDALGLVVPILDAATRLVDALAAASEAARLGEIEVQLDADTNGWRALADMKEAVAKAREGAQWEWQTSDLCTTGAEG